MDTVVLIVGAGPSGLATSASLRQYSIPHIVLEAEDCTASLWRKNAYDRVNLHLAKEFCYLPFAPHPESAPTFLSKAEFLQYVDNYINCFDIRPHFCRLVQSAKYNEGVKKWHVEAENTQEGKVEGYVARFLVVATGENNEAYIPEVPGLDNFKGEIVHSKYYKSGSKYVSKDVLVVGAGNSGMEIALDLFNHGANTSVLIRSPVHVVTKEMVHRGMRMLDHFPVELVDPLIILLSKLEFGYLSKYGIIQPKEGPFYIKETKGRSPIVDVGTIDKIKDGSIKVVCYEIVRIDKNNVIFKDETQKEFDVIVFATGYTSKAHHWLKDYKYVLNDIGMPKNRFPSHWKGEKGLYCAGLSRRGLFGSKMDATAIAEDIYKALKSEEE